MVIGGLISTKCVKHNRAGSEVAIQRPGEQRLLLFFDTEYQYDWVYEALDCSDSVVDNRIRRLICTICKNMTT